MFNLCKIVSVFALLDYIIYSFYKKNYDIKINQDSYKYRIIICFIFWFLIGFIITFNLLKFEDTKLYFLYVSLIALLLYILLNGYNKFYNKNYSIKFICSDIVFGIIIANILVLIFLSIK